MQLPKIIIALSLLSALPLSSSIAQERDPFAPYLWDKPSSVETIIPSTEDLDHKSPLANAPLSTFKIVGTVVTPNEAIAVVKTEDKREFFVGPGDVIGMEGGKVESISNEGVTLATGDTVVTLDVNNKFELGSDID